ncbi:MAG: alcohol dehydrogenase family protein [Pseudomonadota bacterium]
MTLPSTMSGVQLTGHGGPDVLVWNDAIPLPKPGPSEILVRVLAAGVNNTDINTRTGWYSKEVRDPTDSSGAGEVEAGGWGGALTFPRIQGGDLCGRVVALGSGVSDFVEGQRVTCAINQPTPSSDNPVGFVALGSEYDGAFAQYCRVPADQLFDVTDSPLSDVEIAALPCAFGTAENLVVRSGVSSGDRVFVTGASGGVGMAAVQLAKLRGAHITAQASGPKQRAVLDAGADVVVDRGEVPEPGSMTVVIDIAGGPDWGKLIDALRPGGRYATSGAIAGPIVEADLRTLYLNDLTIYGCTYQPREVFQGLVDLINNGGIRPLVSQTYPLAEITRAQADFAEKRYPGKLVLIPPGLDEEI